MVIHRGVVGSLARVASAVSSIVMADKMVPFLGVAMWVAWQSINSRDVLKDPPSVSGAFQHKKMCFSANRFSSWVMAGSQGPGLPCGQWLSKRRIFSRLQDPKPEGTESLKAGLRTPGKKISTAG